MNTKSNYWNHRVLAFVKNEEITFSIRKVHFEKGIPVSYEPAGIDGHGQAECIRKVDEMLLAMNKPTLWGGERFPEEYISKKKEEMKEN